MIASDARVVHIESHDPRLGRHIVHDPRSKAFPLAAAATIDKSTWVTKTHRIYDPVPNPNQKIGDCTGCAQMMLFNSAGNRVYGRVLGLKQADQVYSLATAIDEFGGTYPPDDTGSSGLAAAKASVQLGLGGAYSWIFNGADGVVQAIMRGHTVAVGTNWYAGMESKSASGFIAPTGALAGGHEYVYRGYNKPGDYLIGRCWWGGFKDFKIKRGHANQLLLDGGDAHVQKRNRG